MLEETARRHPHIATFPADLQAVETPEAIVRAAVDRWKTVDVLVNNAGATAVMPLASASASAITDLFTLNVTAPSMLASAAPLTRSWALELAADRIRVNALAPGPTETEALASAGLSEDMIARIKQDEIDRIPSAGAANPTR